METKFEFTPKQWILVKSNKSGGLWTLMRYSHMNGAYLTTTGGIAYYTQDFDIIPFEGNENLLGTADDYMESFEPKDGDFVFATDNETGEKFIVIFQEYTSRREGEGFYGYAYCDIASDRICPKRFVDPGNVNIRPATEEEKQTLLDALHEVGKDWDAEKKEIVDYKWKPKQGESYFTPVVYQTEFEVRESVWRGNAIEEDFFFKGWVFQTEEKCQPFCDKLNEAIKNVK